MPTPNPPTEKKLGGGLAQHKPDCKCRPCSSRRRKEEALAIRDRELRQQTVNGLANNNHQVFIAQWIEWKALEPNLQHKEAAERLGIHPRTLTRAITQARNQGWLKDLTPFARIEHEIIPKALDNLSEFLDQKDHQATLETLKGTAFPIYREFQGAGDAPKVMLALKIETSAPDASKVITGHVVGKPKELGD